MNNHDQHNHNEPLYDEYPLGGSSREHCNIEWTRASIPCKQRPTIQKYRITIEHGSIRIGQERVASALPA